MAAVAGAAIGNAVTAIGTGVGCGVGTAVSGRASGGREAGVTYDGRLAAASGPVPTTVPFGTTRPTSSTTARRRSSTSAIFCGRSAGSLRRQSRMSCSSPGGTAAGSASIVLGRRGSWVMCWTRISA